MASMTSDPNNGAQWEVVEVKQWKQRKGKQQSNEVQDREIWEKAKLLHFSHVK